MKSASMMSPAERQTQMYGCTTAALQQDWETVKRMYPFRELYAMAILSDAQEEMARGNVERARQYVNKAKWHLSEYMVARRGGFGPNELSPMKAALVNLHNSSGMALRDDPDLVVVNRQALARVMELGEDA